MKKVFYVILGMLVLALSHAANNKLDTIVVFGDSSSDNGNLYRFLWSKYPISPPYYEGRFSNGPLWIEQLHNSYFPSNYIQGTQNYAVAGAGAVFSYKEQLPFTLAIELADYLYWSPYGKKESSLYVIWIGANNYVAGPTDVDSITDSVIDAIDYTVEQIIKEGGNKFLIPNLPDLGKTPSSVEQHLEGLVTELVQTHNKKLAAKIQELKAKYPNAIFVPFDVYSYFNQALEHARDLGFSNWTEPCYMGSYSGWLKKEQPSDAALRAFLKQQDPRFEEGHWDMIKNNPELKEGLIASYVYQLIPKKHQFDATKCDTYVFWDKIHSTTKTHSYLAQQAREVIDEAGLQAFTSD